MKRIFFVILAIIFNLSIIFPQTNSKLSADAINLIYESVYEVVLKKPFDSPYTKELKIKEKREKEIKEDPMIYSEEIPWDNLPFAFKADEYYSIGTAFAVSENTFITASHVVSFDKKMLWEEVFIRDKTGNVFEIDQVLKYSNQRDFVVFTVKNKKNTKFLKINTGFNINSVVFAVGNAFGEGIVIRDGLLTSMTKESERGEWDWIRFSAAASPGNSGGPLLNDAGEVIGIVLRKSQDENLNYALPLNELNKIKENTASFHAMLTYSLLFTTKKYGPERYDKDIVLPMDYKKLRNIIVDFTKEISTVMKDKLLEKNADFIFPKASGSKNLFHLIDAVYFPHLIAENENDGVWDIYRPKDLKTSQLENNGYLNYGLMSNIGMFEFKKPDNIELKDFLENSKLFMDNFLKGYTLNRTFNDKNIRIASIGEPVEKYEYIDKYKRKWIVEGWNLEFANSKILFFSLPVPLGRVGFLILNDVHFVDTDMLVDVKEYTNFLFYSYNGTLKQWKSFFGNASLLPENFKSYSLKINDNSFGFKSSRFNIDYAGDFFKVNDDGFLVLKNSYIKDKELALWDISGLSLWENKNNKSFIGVLRFIKPEKDLPEKFTNEWDDLLLKKYPFDRVPHAENGKTIISGIHNDYNGLDEKILQGLDKVYSVGMGVEGKSTDEELLKKYDLLNSEIKILENDFSIRKGKLRH